MRVQSKTKQRKQFSSEFEARSSVLVTEAVEHRSSGTRPWPDDNMVSRWKKEAQQNGQRAFPVKAIPKTKNCPGCGVRTKCYAKSGRF